MVVVRPFRAIRPKASLADKVAELPYDVVDSSQARDLAEGNPYSYFHIDKAEIDLAQSISPYDAQVYQKAAANLTAFFAKGLVKKRHTRSLLFIPINDEWQKSDRFSCLYVD